MRTVCSANTMRTRSEVHQEGLLNTVIREIQSIVDYRRAHKIVPERATWRMLRDRLTEEEFAKLERLVEVGVVKEYRGIAYPSYEVDYVALNRYKADIQKLG